MGLLYKLRERRFVVMIFIIALFFFVLNLHFDSDNDLFTSRIKSLNCGETIAVGEIFDFDRAYVFDEPYLTGEYLAKNYKLDISIEEVEAVVDSTGRIVFVDDSGNYVAQYTYSREEISLQERVILTPTTVVQADFDNSGNIVVLHLIGVDRF